MICTQCNNEVPGNDLFGVCTKCAPTTLPGVIASVQVADFWGDNTLASKQQIASAVQKAVSVSSARKKPKKEPKKDSKQTSF